MNKNKLYNLIIESVSKELQNILQFDNSNIFNNEDSYFEFDDSYESNTTVYKNSIKKALIGKANNQELNYISNIKKYKIDTKEELRSIIEIYSKKNPTGTLNWIDTSNITDMSELFAFTNYNGDISEWDTSNVTTMKSMFYCNGVFDQPIGDWDVSNVTDMGEMFHNACSFNQDIKNWDVSKVYSMAWMFNYACKFNQRIGNWKVDNVKYMQQMFCGAKNFNQTLFNWDISNVINVTSMFENAIKFNKNLSSWIINEKKVSCQYMFYKCNIKERNMPKFICI